MEAMILAAGAGTRLRPITDRIPKALVAVSGRPLLSWVMDRLAGAGVTRLIVNTHYHESQIRSYLEQSTPTSLEVVLSHEPDGPYDTGGGLFAARQLFREGKPFLLHNVDVLSRIPLDSLLAAHLAAREACKGKLLASLAVQSTDADRILLFDDVGLVGWENVTGEHAVVSSLRVRDPVGELKRWAFTGIHVIEPSVFHSSDRSGSFSIITLYLELAARGYVIAPVDMTAYDWFDVGTHEQLAKAEKAVGR